MQRGEHGVEDLVPPGHPYKYFRHTLVKSLPGEGFRTVGLPPDPNDGLYGLTGFALFPDTGFAEASLEGVFTSFDICLLYTSPSPRDGLLSRMPSSA